MMSYDLISPRAVQSIHCTFPDCACKGFKPLNNEINSRSCQNCHHGWVAHALNRLVSTNIYAGLTGNIEPITPSLAFDVASLILYGCQAIPIRLKIALDRLFSILQSDDVLKILHEFNWSYEDYARGYIVQDNTTGKVIDKWNMLTREEELYILQQFSNFSVTQTVVQNLLATSENKHSPQETSHQQPNQAKIDYASRIRKFTEQANRSNLGALQQQLFRGSFESSPPNMLPGFLPGLNFANVAALAAQLNTGLRQPNSGMFSAGFPAMPKVPKPEPVTKAEQPLIKPERRSLLEPFDLTKRGPESQGHPSPSSQSPSSSAAQTPVSMAQSVGERLDLPANRSNLNSSPNLLKADNSTQSSKSGWPYNNLSFGQTVFVASSGKKRVLCTACNKTFCDKGALKIHYSAVHLKEMHKCSIPGCNMMFSSRRSRNRHSANPNPKLHTPQTTRRPRERFDPAQPHMMSLSAQQDDLELERQSGSMSPNTPGHLMPEHYEGDVSPDISVSVADDEEGTEIDLDNSLPTQVQVKHDSPLFSRLNKRKRKMPTQVISDNEGSSSANKNADSDSEEPMVDPLAAGDGMFNHKPSSKNSSPEPGEVKRVRAASPSLVDDGNRCDDPVHPLAGGDALFPNFDNQSSNFWSKLIQKTAQKMTSSQMMEGGDRSKMFNEVPVDSDNPRRCTECGEVFPNTFSLKLHFTEEHMLTNKGNMHRPGKPHTASSPNNSRAEECPYCDKRFPTHETLGKHVSTAHQGQESMYSEYMNSMEAVKQHNKTPVISA